MGSERRLSQTAARRVEGAWKTLTLIGVIAGTGFGAATFLGGYKTETEAAADHVELRVSTTKIVKPIVEQVDEHDDEIEAIRYVNVRIEVAQQQVLDELRRSRIAANRTQGRAEREAQDQEIADLEERIGRRADALQKSYTNRPVIGGRADSIPETDPLAGIDGI